MSKIKSLIKTKPKNYKDGDVIEVSLMVMHPMETGMRKDKKTQELIPANYISSVTFIYNGKTITTMNVWESVSTNPVFKTNMKINGAGEFKAIFTENTGGSHEQTIKIKPKA